MIRRRARAAGIETEIGCHTFRPTGITAYLENGGTLEHAQQIAAHESPRLADETAELPGVLVYGATPKEAQAKAQALALRVLADRLENGEASPFAA